MTQKEDSFIKEGFVTDSLPNGMFRVRLVEDNTLILGYVSGKMRANFIRVLPGDRVKVQQTEYDRTKGRIIYRFRKDESNTNELNKNKSKKKELRNKKSNKKELHKKKSNKKELHKKESDEKELHKKQSDEKELHKKESDEKELHKKQSDEKELHKKESDEKE
uniref:Translation initiation factor IF-1 n=1 Tax=Drosera indica TaxID=16680 RepID=A0A411K3B2_9CARY|nr:translation initiation factor 1 [Drosera indica]